MLVIESLELQTYAALVVEKMLKALKLHSNEARMKFPRLLQIIEQYPEETLSLMTKEVSIFIVVKGSFTELRHITIYIHINVCNAYIIAFPNQQ